MDKVTIEFYKLVIRLLKMILHIITYPDFREADCMADVHIQDIQSDASLFLSTHRDRTADGKD